MMLHGIPIPQDRIAELCRRYGASRMALFGSILRADFDSQSDIDVLVDFPPNATFSLLDLGGMLMELREIFRREVHLVTPRMLPERYRYDVSQQARTLYVAA